MPLPSPRLVKEAFPASSSLQYSIAKNRATLRAIAQNQDPRLLIIAGPCSIHDIASAKDYAMQFKQLSSEVQDSCFLIMRAFFEKPRTQSGWTGFLNDPYLDGTQNIEEGLFLTREFLIYLVEQEIPVCTEFLHPLSAVYYEDLITLGIIGARTSASQPHRHLASFLSMPIGFKNSIDGNIETALQGIVTARQPHSLLSIDHEGRACVKESTGNSASYLILRGSQNAPNYDLSSLEEAGSLADNLDVPRRFIIDCSHGNSGKSPERQIDVFRTCLSYREQGRREMMGLMLESHLEKGAQIMHHAPHRLQYGVSITDPCLDWSSTAQLIEEAHYAFQESLTPLIVSIR